MFAQYAVQRRRFPARAAAFSVVLHLGVLGLVLKLDSPSARKNEPLALTFYKPPPPPPPVARPPPPPPAAKTPRPNPVKVEPVHKVEIPTSMPRPQEVAHAPQAAEPSEIEAPAAAGGVEGGTEGGVAGGTVGGLVSPDAPAAPAKPKNVPAFVIQRDMLQQTPLRLPEVFKQAHRGAQLTGMYKVCVGIDGRVYEVGVVKSVPGADEAIVAGIREGWLYKAQQVPVCFLYNMPISVQ